MYCFAIHSIVHSMYFATLVHFIPNAVVPSISLLSNVPYVTNNSLRSLSSPFLLISVPWLARYAYKNHMELYSPFFFSFPPFLCIAKLCKFQLAFNMLPFVFYNSSILYSRYYLHNLFFKNL